MIRTATRTIFRAAARPAAHTTTAAVSAATRAVRSSSRSVGALSPFPLAAGARGLATITYSAPQVKVGHTAPGFNAGAVVDGEIKKVSLSDYAPGSWKVLLFYPKDFTFVCPTELIAFSDAAKQFEAVNAKVIGISTDTEESHLAWVRTPRKKGGLGHMQIPLVADVTKAISADYGVLIEDIGIALRGLFIIDPKGVVQQITVNNLPVGRDVSETIRLIQAFQFVAEHGEVCPAGWKPGEKTMKADPEGSLEYFATVDEADDDLKPGPRVVEIKSPKQFADVVKSKPKVVVDFVAPWCGKCKQIMPYVNQLSEEYTDVTFVKVDTTVEALTDLLPANGVTALPHFSFFKDGKASGSPIVGYKKTPLKDAVAALAKS